MLIKFYWWQRSALLVGSLFPTRWKTLWHGFGFLSREAGFEIGETTLLSYNAGDTYLRALAVGLLNTFRVASLAIVLSTMLGALIGLARLSLNWLLAKLAAGYIEVIRTCLWSYNCFFGTP